MEDRTEANAVCPECDTHPCKCRFDDPVVRCVDCQKMVYRDILPKLGCCPDCGCKRVKSILILKPEEMEDLQAKGHSDFVKLFEVADNE